MTEHEIGDTKIFDLQAQVWGLKQLSEAQSKITSELEATISRLTEHKAAQEKVAIAYLSMNSRLTAERDGARAAAIEECAKVLDSVAQDWNRIRDPGMANNARAYAKKLRRLATPPDSDADGAGQ